MFHLKTLMVVVGHVKQKKEYIYIYIIYSFDTL